MIAIICPVHTNPEVVAAQIKNYELLHGDQAIHILHPSLEGGIDFSHIKKDNGINCEVLLCKEQWPTHYRCTIGAAISATQMINEIGSEISHVYYHSDSDLLVTDGFVETIQTHNNGYATRSISAVAEKKSRELRDVRFKVMRNELGLNDEDIRVGRIEGCFFEIDVWREMLGLISKHYSKEYLGRETHWPLEAGLFPTLARKLLDQEKPSTRHLVRTKYVKPNDVKDHARQIEDSKIQIEDIIQERRKNNQKLCFAMKWFSTELNHPARKFLTETLGN